MALSPYVSHTNATSSLLYNGLSQGCGGLARLSDGKYKVIEKSPAFIFGEQLRKAFEGAASLWRSFLTFPGADASTEVALLNSKSWETAFDVRVKEEAHAATKTALYLRRVEYLGLVKRSEEKTAHLEKIVESEVGYLEGYCVSLLKIGHILEEVLRSLRQVVTSESSPGELKRLDLCFPIHRVREGIIYKNGIVELPPKGLSLDTTRCFEKIDNSFFIDPLHLRFPFPSPREEMSLSEFKEFFSPESIAQLEKDLNHWITVNSTTIEREIYQMGKMAAENMKEQREEVSALFNQIYDQLPLGEGGKDLFYKKDMGADRETITVTSPYDWKMIFFWGGALFFTAWALLTLIKKNSLRQAANNGEQIGNLADQNPPPKKGDTFQVPTDLQTEMTEAISDSQPLRELQRSEEETLPTSPADEAGGADEETLFYTTDEEISQQFLLELNNTFGDLSWEEYVKGILPKKTDKRKILTPSEMTLLLLAETIVKMTKTEDQTLIDRIKSLRESSRK